MSAQPPPQPPPQQPPQQQQQQQQQQDLTLEIHHLFVVGGDATAIVVRNTGDGKIKYKVLLDSGAEGSGSSFLSPYMGKYLEGDKKFDLVIATHYHQDHFNGFMQAPVKFTHYMDNGGYQVGGEKFTPKNGTGFKKTTPLFMSYTNHVRSQTATRIPVPFIKDDFNQAAIPLKHELGAGTNIFLTCYCANGILANGENGGKNVIKTQQKKKHISPNDVSMAFVLEWGEFRYFTAGDLSGDPTLKKYLNIEKELVDFLTDSTKGPLKDKPITVLKASHHGSEHSNQTELFDQLKPQTIVVSCNQIKEVPSPEFLTRVEKYLKKVEGRTIVFANELNVKRTDLVNRLGPLRALDKYIASNNVKFVKNQQQEDTSASNEHVHAIVIRRRQPGGAKPDDPQGDNVEKIDKGTYEILMRVPGQGVANKWRATGTYDSLLISFEKTNQDGSSVKDDIDAGLRLQAQAIVRWLKEDDNHEASTGLEYVAKNYPGLTEAINDHFQSESSTDAKLEESLVATMGVLFDNTYVEGEGKEEDFYVPDKEAFNDLEPKDQETIVALLWNNRYQATFGYKVGNQGWVEEKTWNYFEPYEPEGGKRKGGVEKLQPPRRSKRLKT